MIAILSKKLKQNHSTHVRETNENLSGKLQ